MSDYSSSALVGERTDNVLADLITRATQGVDTLVMFGKEQLPDLINQLLVWKFIESMIPFVLGLLVILAAWPLFKFLVRLKRKAEADYKEGKAWTHYTTPENLGGISITSVKYDAVVLLGSYAPTFMVLLIVSGGTTMLSNLTWIQILVAPKVYLLQYAADLVK